MSAYLFMMPCLLKRNYMCLSQEKEIKGATDTKTGAPKRSYADFFPSNSGLTIFATLNSKSALVKISHRMIDIIELDRCGSSWNGGYVSSYPSQHSKYTGVNEVEKLLLKLIVKFDLCIVTEAIFQYSWHFCLCVCL